MDHECMDHETCRGVYFIQRYGLSSMKDKVYGTRRTVAQIELAARKLSQLRL